MNEFDFPNGLWLLTISPAFMAWYADLKACSAKFFYCEHNLVMDISRNFQSIMWATNELLSTTAAKPLSDLEILKKGVQVFRNSNPNRDYRPVGMAEASIIFNDYYDEKYGLQKGKRHKVRDASLRRAKALSPHGVESFMYRPIRNGDGKLIASGPEKHDFSNIDDGEQNDFFGS